MKSYFLNRPDEKTLDRDVLILPFAQTTIDGQKKALPLFSIELPSPIADAIDLILRNKAFQGDLEELFVHHIHLPIDRRILFVGLGSLEDDSFIDDTRASFAKAMKFLKKERNVRSVSLCMPKDSRNKNALFQAVFEGVGFGLYAFRKYMTKNTLSSTEDLFEEIYYITDDIPVASEIEARSSIVLSAITSVRDLVNMNACEATPQALAAASLELTKIPGIEVSCYDSTWIRNQKMGLVQAVGQGAANTPMFVVIDWKGATSDRTVFIGKGVTYDTGGLNIKPTGSMETMRADMAGAAALIGLMNAVGHLKLPIWITAVLPLVENAVDANSMRPGDVYVSRKGTTVEIGNTDAEGRLILADAMDYAVTDLNPARIIDVATLTGASEVALGTQISALFSNNNLIAEAIERASIVSGEPIHRLPLYKKYFSLLKSDFADMKNVTGTRVGGAINAALFLEHFIGKTAWAHLDIAGPSYLKDGKGIYGPGATSIPMRTLLAYCDELAVRKI